MGREIKRVALDFQAEIGVAWPGYVNEHYRECPHCLNGQTIARSRLEDLVSLILLSGEDAKRERAHPYFNWSPLYHTGGKICEPEMLSLTDGLAGREASLFGYDCVAKYVAAKKIIVAAGLPEDWGICSHCKGDCIDPEAAEAYNNWQATEPPTGEGYQLWETTSEGSPMTPVFATPEELARHCADKDVSSFGGQTEDYETWLRFIAGPGWAPSAIMAGGQMQSGVAAIVEGRP